MTTAGLLTLTGGDALAAGGSISPTGALIYIGDKGELNDVTVVQVAKKITITDAGAVVTPGTGCQAIAGNPHSIACNGLAVTSLALNGADGDDTLRNKTALPAQLVGGSDADVLVGGSAQDALIGGSGGDTLDGRGGPDSFDGGGGTDIADYSQSPHAVTVTLDGTADDGVKFEGDNVLGSVEDVIGSGGGDSLRGNGAANRLDGADGDDTLDGGTGADELLGGAGIDTATYAGRVLPLHLSLDGVANDGAAAESDQLGAGIENLVAGDGDDVLTGDGADNLLDGGLGDDQIAGGGGDDTVTYATRTADVQVQLGSGLPEGQAGEADGVADDVEGAIGGSGDDKLRDFTLLPGRHFAGNAGADEILAGGGGMLLDGGPGDDTLGGGIGADTILGGAGKDQLFGLPGDDVLDGGDDADRVDGGGDADLIRGGAGDDTLNGHDSAFLTVDDKPDDIQGGTGVDTVRYSRLDNVTVRLNDAPDDGALGEGDNVHTDTEVVLGGNGDDRLVGSPADDTLNGGPGEDDIDGRLGADTLIGGQGGDDINAVDGFVDTITCGGDGGDSLAADIFDAFDPADCNQ